MLFKRRQKAGLGERVRLVLWPRRSFSRSLQYFAKRVLRLRATPHAGAAGVAAGIFASFFPLGLHVVIAMVVAWLVAGGAPLPHIQARLGHESITTTIDTYGHLLPAGDELISGIIDTALTGGTIRPARVGK